MSGILLEVKGTDLGNPGALQGCKSLSRAGEPPWVAGPAMRQRRRLVGPEVGRSLAWQGV